MNRQLAVFWWLITALFGIATAYVLIQGRVLHHGYPYNTFLFDPRLRFLDLTIFREAFGHFGRPDFYYDSAFIYGPLIPVLLRPLFLLSYIHLMTVYFGIAFGFVAVLAGLLTRGMSLRGVSAALATLFVLTLIVTSYPLWILFDRANIELFVWIVIAAGLIAFHREHWMTAAICFGIATSMKYYPAIFFALLLSEKRWREIVAGIVSAVALCAIALRISCSSIADGLAGMIVNMTVWSHVWVMGDKPLETAFQHSLWALAKQLMYVNDYVYMWRPGYHVYQYVSAVLGLHLYFAVMRRMPRLNQILAITICSVLLPAWSSDYTLVHLYVPFALFVFWTLDHPGMQRFETWCSFVCFAVLFTPQPYLTIGVRGYSGQIKAVALIVLLYVVLRYRFEESVAGQEAINSPAM